jgi:hypothetical protein
VTTCHRRHRWVYAPLLSAQIMSVAAPINVSGNAELNVSGRVFCGGSVWSPRSARPGSQTAVRPASLSRRDQPASGRVATDRVPRRSAVYPRRTPGIAAEVGVHVSGLSEVLLCGQRWGAMPTQPWNSVVGESGGPNSRDIACDLDKVPNRSIRDLVRGVLTGRTGITVEDAVLVAEELVSNAHRHGDAPRVCRLTLLGQGRRLRIEVDDASPTQPRMRTPDNTGGRGLVLVNMLASAWGVQRHAHHKTVWAELALDRPGSSGHAPHMTAAPDLAAAPPTRRSR